MSWIEVRPCQAHGRTSGDNCFYEYLYSFCFQEFIVTLPNLK